MLARRLLLDIWSPCPITQNGVLRIMFQPSYPNHRPAKTSRIELRTTEDERDLRQRTIGEHLDPARGIHNSLRSAHRRSASR